MVYLGNWGTSLEGDSQRCSRERALVALTVVRGEGDIRARGRGRRRQVADTIRCTTRRLASRSPETRGRESDSARADLLPPVAPFHEPGRRSRKERVHDPALTLPSPVLTVEACLLSRRDRGRRGRQK